MMENSAIEPSKMLDLSSVKMFLSSGALADVQYLID